MNQVQRMMPKMIATNSEVLNVEVEVDFSAMAGTILKNRRNFECEQHSSVSINHIKSVPMQKLAELLPLPCLNKHSSGQISRDKLENNR